MKIENIDELNKLINEGYISSVKHPSEDLWLLCYTKSCQFEKVWNELTTTCRGLIIDSEYNIIQRPFKKFFNYEELTNKSEIPNLPFKVYEKVDGSLGILYWVKDVPYMCTKGSWISDQGVHATNLLHTKYKDTWNRLDKSKTYLFEIIYPEDRHVVNYQKFDDIILLAIFDTETGKEFDIYDYSDIFTCVKQYEGIKDWKTIRDEFDGENREGFVIRFSNGYRLKLKYESYFRLHFLKSYLTEKYILEICTAGQDEDEQTNELIQQLVEEDQIYYHSTIKKFKDQYNQILTECQRVVDQYKDLSQKDVAVIFLKHKYSGVLFGLRNNKKVDNIIWKYIKKELLCHQN